MNNEPKKKALSGKLLLLVAAVAYVIGWLMGWGESVLGGAFALVGHIALLLSIIAFVREARARRRDRRIP